METKFHPEHACFRHATLLSFPMIFLSRKTTLMLLAIMADLNSYADYTNNVKCVTSNKKIDVSVCLNITRAIGFMTKTTSDDAYILLEIGQSL